MPGGDQHLSAVGKCIPVRNYSEPSDASLVLKYDSLTIHSLGKMLCCQRICVPKICLNFTCESPENITMLRDDALSDAGE